MATFITTLHFTEQGVKAVRDTCERAAAFKSAAEKLGVKVTGQYWTLGAFDGVVVCEAPDEATATAALLHLGALGNIGRRPPVPSTPPRCRRSSACCPSESPDRLDALRHVILGVVYQGADPVGQHPFCGEGPQEIPQLLAVLAPGVEPEVVLVRWEDYRHPLVDRLHQLVGVRGQDRAGLDRLLPFLPALPQPGQAEGTLALQADTVGLLVPVGSLPLV